MPTIAFLANLSTADHNRRWDLLVKHAGDGVNAIVVDPTLSPGEMMPGRDQEPGARAVDFDRLLRTSSY